MKNSLPGANIVYAIGSVASSAALLLVVPFLTHALTTSEFGVWILLEVAIQILSSILAAGMDVGLMRMYWLQEDEEEQRRLAGTVILGTILWGLFFTACLMVVIEMVSMEKVVAATPRVAAIALLAAYFETVLRIVLSLFRIREEPFAYVKLAVGRVLLFMMASIGLVALGQGLIGAITGRALAALLTLLFGIWYSRRYYSVCLDWERLKRVLTYGLPLVPTNLAAYVLFASDRYFLEFYTSAAIVGVYSFAYKVASVFQVVVVRPFALDWAPRRYKIERMDNARERYADILYLFLFGATFVILAIQVVSPLLYDWFAPEIYSMGRNVLPILLLGLLAYGLSYPLNIGIVIRDKTSYAALVGGFAAAATIVFNFLLIPSYGMLGAAWATVLAYSVWTAGMTVVSLRLYPIRYSIPKLGAICVAAVMAYLGIQFSEQLFSGSALAQLGLSVIWLLVIYGLAGFTILKDQVLAIVGDVNRTL
jgi:O-antigen/teichoic acid export membrane protein